MLLQIKSKYIIGNLLNSPEVYFAIRKTMKKLFSDVKITGQEIADIMANDIIKRAIIDSDESKKAKKDIEKIYKKLEKIKEKNKGMEFTDTLIGRPATHEGIDNFQSEGAVPVLQVYQDKLTPNHNSGLKCPPCP
ncbi:MAG: hypothetical protein LBB98_09925 [Treponema sp.]|jgi:hypothetical protein|nr:hypothetical protein [Treponema sp.]